MTDARDDKERARRIAELNDEFRSNIIALALAGRDAEAAKLGRLLLTRSIGSLSPADQIGIVNAVRRFRHFTADNDPHGHHDYGSFALHGESYCWRIGCFDAASGYTRGSEDEANPAITARVLTIMRPDED
jgi:hypothetical protein